MRLVNMTIFIVMLHLNWFLYIFMHTNNFYEEVVFLFSREGSHGDRSRVPKRFMASQEFEVFITKEYWDKEPVPVSHWRKGKCMGR